MASNSALKGGVHYVAHMACKQDDILLENDYKTKTSFFTATIPGCISINIDNI